MIVLIIIILIAALYVVQQFTSWLDLNLKSSATLNP